MHNNMFGACLYSTGTQHKISCLNYLWPWAGWPILFCGPAWGTVSAKTNPVEKQEADLKKMKMNAWGKRFSADYGVPDNGPHTKLYYPKLTQLKIRKRIGKKMKMNAWGKRFSADYGVPDNDLLTIFSANPLQKPQLNPIRQDMLVCSNCDPVWPSSMALGW